MAADCLFEVIDHDSLESEFWFILSDVLEQHPDFAIFSIFLYHSDFLF